MEIKREIERGVVTYNTHIKKGQRGPHVQQTTCNHASKFAVISESENLYIFFKKKEEEKKGRKREPKTKILFCIKS